MMVQTEQRNSGKDFWRGFIDTVKPKEYNSVSEYELYFNFALKHRPETARLRTLAFANGPAPGLIYQGGDEAHMLDPVWKRGSIERQISKDVQVGYDYVGYHHYAKRRYYDVPQKHVAKYCSLGLGERNSQMKRRCHS